MNPLSKPTKRTSPWMQACYDALLNLQSEFKYRDPMDAPNGNDQTLAKMGLGEKLQIVVIVNQGQTLSDNEKADLWNDKALTLGKRWAEVELRRTNDLSLTHVEKRNRLRAYDSLVFWELLLMNMNPKKLELFKAVLDKEKTDKAEADAKAKG
jgi:hypothetical protein